MCLSADHLILPLSVINVHLAVVDVSTRSAGSAVRGVHVQGVRGGVY